MTRYSQKSEMYYNVLTQRYGHDMILWNMAMGPGMGPIACFRDMGGFP